MNTADFNEGLLTFLRESPTPFHATATMAGILKAGGFRELDETARWDLSPGRYFVTRNRSSLIAFVLGTGDPSETGLRICGAHTDSPCLKVKPHPDIHSQGYLQVGVEVYGGALLNPWFDRDLSLAGRVTVQADDSRIHHVLIDFRDPVAVLPSLAIHLDRDANKSRCINSQKHLPPILMRSDTASLQAMLLDRVRAEHAAIEAERVLAFELFFYDTHPPAIVGMDKAFIAGARLDNLLSCYVNVRSLSGADPALTSMIVCNDHEEVGSASSSGAAGTFLRDVLSRMLPETEPRLQAIARSVLVSTDNAHGIHPNYPDRHDTRHGPVLNGGPVIKINANQRYASNSETEGYFASLCEKAGLPYQKFVNRTDMACGSTIGPITASEIGIRTVDVGVPTFAMHSIRELAGTSDAHTLYLALGSFFRDPVPGGPVS